MVRRQSTHNAADSQEVADDEHGIMSRMGIDWRRAPDPHAYGRQAAGGLRHSLSPVSALVFTMMGDRALSVTDPHERK
jgi:hypothetical protein